MTKRKARSGPSKARIKPAGPRRGRQPAVVPDSGARDEPLEPERRRGIPPRESIEDPLSDWPEVDTDLDSPSGGREGEDVERP